MKANEFFNEMKRIARAWDKTSDFPYTSGAMKALYAWESSIGYGENELEMNEFTWSRENHDFIETLRKAGIKTFVVTNSGTSLLENLHAYAAEGCTMIGLCTITRHDRWSDETTEVQGIRFKVN